MKKLSVFLYSMGAGGAERVVSNLLPFLTQKYEVHLFLMSDVVSYEIPNSVKFHFLEHSNPNENKIKKMFRLIFALPFLAFKYKKISNNLGINSHFVLMNRPCYIALISRIFGLKGRLIISERSCPSTIYKKGINGFFNRAFIRLLYNKADLILANAKENADDLIQNFGCDKDKTKVFYNAIDLKSIQKLKNEPLGIDFKPFFLNIGRLDSGKNQSMLIKIIANLKDKRATLGILGDGYMKDELLSLIKKHKVDDRVKLLGVDKNPFKYIKNSSCFVCASRFEGFSNVLLEALACEKTIISTSHKSGAKELLGDNEYGLLVGVDDEKSMQEAMQNILDNEELRYKYESRAYERVKKFDSDIISLKLIEFLEQ
ncbi:glycosyltransferase [Campylobacter pinnipediorum]|uniref:N-acetylgalactosamine-N, N'-diacetylbacillosaminyl-diphospho-undecaprenol 4-alpha-N-acetylgalactosaminyltransferase n=1 Tax=Campylobacter pinnipediorum TaxID=1965231 RepID=UPI00084DFD2C|nr:glycosyltransferase [Campylobacter pinnipediorum]